MSKGYDAHYLNIVDKNGKQTGIAMVNIDNTLTNGFRAFIRHVSTIDPE